MTRLQLIGIACVLVGSAAFAGFGLLLDEDVPFLVQRAGAQWIVPPIPVDSGLRHVGPGQSQGAVFSVELESPGPADARIELRVLGAARASLNGEILIGSDAATPGEGAVSCLKRSCRGRGALRRGANALRVEVVNPVGPPAVWARLESARVARGSDAEWEVSPLHRDTPRLRAQVADDTRPLPESLEVETPWRAAWRQLPLLLVCFGAAFAASLVVQRRASGRMAALAGPRLPLVVLVAVALLWLRVFVAKLMEMPLRTGFDVQGHLEYVLYLLERRALPTAPEGWSMYHPPAFYALVAGVVGVLQPIRGSDLERVAFRALPALFGFAHAALALGLSRRMLPQRFAAQSLCVALAGLLPVNLYMAAYFSNESGHAIAAAAAVWLAVRMMGEAHPTRLGAAALAFFAGLALLAKFTALAIVPIVCAFLLLERACARGLGWARAATVPAAIGGGALLIAGWFYVRNWLLLGDPFVWNNDLIDAEGYWSQPAFHTAAYFTGFGGALVHPYFASFASFWGGLYSTLWGDGMVAGFASIRSRPVQWDASLMSIGYLLALPLSAASALGFAAGVRDSLRGADLSRRCMWALLTTLLFALVFATFWKNVSVPFYGAARASYSLALVAPFALITVRGVLAVDAFVRARSRPGRALVHAWLAVWAIVVVATYAG